MRILVRKGFAACKNFQSRGIISSMKYGVNRFEIEEYKGGEHVMR
jgi:hypothetical protein